MDIARQPPDLEERAAQRGVVTLDRLARRLSEDAIRHRVGKKRLVRLFRGVYREGDVEETPVIRAYGAALAAGDDAVPSHLLAAQVHRLWLPPGWNGAAETRGAKQKGRRAGLTQHRPALRADEVVEVEGVVVADALATVRDVSRTHGRLAAILAAESAVRRQLVTLDQARAAAGRVGYLVDPRSQSPLETHIRLLCHNAGITHLVPQVSVWDDDAWCERFIDLADEERKVGIEGDGRAVHDAPLAVYEDRARQNVLVRLGWIILRFTWRDVLERPDYVVATIRSALESRGWGQAV